MEKQDHLKWFTIGFLSALGFIALALVILIYFVTPLVKVDEATGRVQLLGGIIDLQARDVLTQLSKEGSFVIGNIEGVEKISPAIEVISIKFGSGEVRVDYNTSDEMNWDCDGAGKNAQLIDSDDKKGITLDFSSAFIDCDVSVPVRKVSIEGMSGEVEVRKIQSDLFVKLTTGDVFLDPIAAKNYEFDLKAINGEVDETFKSATQKTPLQSPIIKVKAEVRVGNIQSLD